MSDVKRYAFQIHRRPYGLEEISSGNLVLHSDYAKLEAESQTLREEVAALRARVVVMPERMTIPVESSGFVNGKLYGWNHCLDELARLNGKVVSEGLLRRIEQECRKNHDWNCQNVPAGTRSATTRARAMLDIADELRALLDKGKES